MADKLVLNDYIGSNPSKGGVFRSGPMLNGDGIVGNWLGHASFSMGTLSLGVRRLPAFFETFAVILIDQTSTVRADIAFGRQSLSTYSMEQSAIQLYLSGGTVHATEYALTSLVKDYGRKAQFGEIFTFDKKTSRLTDGVFRTSGRGWYSFSHFRPHSALSRFVNLVSWPHTLDSGLQRWASSDYPWFIIIWLWFGR